MATPGVKGGQACIRGTRIPVEVILQSIVDGYSIDDLVNEYRLEKEDVLACVEFARQLVTLHWKTVLRDQD